VGVAPRAGDQQEDAPAPEDERHLLRSFHTAGRTLEGIESSHVMRKGQVNQLDGGDSAGQAKFVQSLFGVAA
jgi:hypothetical protein